MRVQVLMAWPHRHLERVVELEEGATVAEAIRASGLLEEGGPIAGQAVFGVAVAAGARLRDGDRLELLRPLQMDPKEARRRRAEAAAGRR